MENSGPSPIEDPEQLDERRAATGLEPLADYEVHVHVRGSLASVAGYPPTGPQAFTWRFKMRDGDSRGYEWSRVIERSRGVRIAGVMVAPSRR
jgi:hypothetical protein